MGQSIFTGVQRRETNKVSRLFFPLELPANQRGRLLSALGSREVLLHRLEV